MTIVILGVDPGSIMSAYCLVDAGDMRPLVFGKVPNPHLVDIIKKYGRKYRGAVTVVIEGVASYGMPVGKAVFDTCEWIGRYKQTADNSSLLTGTLYRKDVTSTVCHSARAGDSNVRRALIDKFAKHDLINGKGQKGKPDFFYGFAADVWSAYALAYSYIIMRLGEGWRHGGE